MADPIIRAADVSKIYGGGTSAVTALAGVNIAVEAGERVAILGKSGSGKSTLMNLIGGLDVPSTGTLTVAGRSLGSLSRGQLADYRRDCVGFVFQSFHLIAGRTVQENVELPLMLAGASVARAPGRCSIPSACRTVCRTSRRNSPAANANASPWRGRL